MFSSPFRIVRILMHPIVWMEDNKKEPDQGYSICCRLLVFFIQLKLIQTIMLSKQPLLSGLLNTFIFD